MRRPARRCAGGTGGSSERSLGLTRRRWACAAKLSIASKVMAQPHQPPSASLRYARSEGYAMVPLTRRRGSNASLPTCVVRHSARRLLPERRRVESAAVGGAGGGPRRHRAQRPAVEARKQLPLATITPPPHAPPPPLPPLPPPRPLPP